MRRSYHIFLFVAIVFASVFSSCNSDDTDTVDYVGNNCSITNMTIGNLKRLVSYTTSAGKDTSYVTTIAGSLYPLYIDQYKGEIYNPDSLPLGTYVDKVIFSSVSSDGYTTYQTAAGNDTLYSSTDSMDFTTPRVFTCYSYSGKAKKTYKVSINVHQINPELFVWYKEVESHAEMMGITSQRAFYKDGKVYVFALSSGNSLLLTASKDAPSQWTSSLLSLTDFDPCSVQLFNDVFYTVQNGKIVTSADGLVWTESDSDFSPAAFIAAGSSFLFAKKGNEIYKSADGVTWEKDLVESQQGKLPSSAYSSVWLPMSFNSDFEYVLLGGVAGESHVEWKKVIDNEGSNSEPWNIYESESDAQYPYPSFYNTQLVKYDSRVFAMGIENDTLSLFHLSNDGGRTWIPQSSTYIHPSSITASNFSWVVDEDKYLWIICGGTGEVWRGRINRLGFKQNQTSFTE